MISQNILNLLTEEEQGLLLYTLNHVKPPGFSVDVDMNIVKFYQDHKLLEILQSVRPNLTNMGQIMLDGIINKLFMRVVAA